MKGHVARAELLAAHLTARGHVVRAQINSAIAATPIKGHVVRAELAGGIATLPPRGHVVRALLASDTIPVPPTVLSTDDVVVPSRAAVTLAAVLQSTDIPTSWVWTQTSGPPATLVPSSTGDTCVVYCPAPIVPADVVIDVQAILPDEDSAIAETIISVKRHRIWVGRAGVERPIGKRTVVVPPKPPGYIPPPVDPPPDPPVDPTGPVGDSTVIAAWGDSLTSGTGGDPGGFVGVIQSHLTGGRTTFNGGRGGETAGEIAIRQGGQGLTLTPTGNVIPASGAVAVTYTENIGWSSNITWSSVGTLAGVPGTISRAIGSTALTFTRTTSGSSVPCTAQPWTSTLGNQYKGNVQILWAGRNDLGNTVIDPAILKARVLAANQAMVNYLTDPDKAYIMLSTLNRSIEGTTSTGGNLTVYNTIISSNAALAAAHGTHYIDVRTYLVQNGLSDAGLTPTSADLAAIAADAIPPQLTIDNLHLTQAGYNIVAKLVEDRMKLLRYIPTAPVTPPVSFTPGLAWKLPDDINNSTKYPVQVFPHYFTPYPISWDNIAVTTTSPYVATDKYSRVWNDPNSGSTDEHTTFHTKFLADGVTLDPLVGQVLNNHYMKNHGGYFRGRPMPRPPIAGTLANAMVEDCKTDIRQAQVSGINGFFVELLGLSGGNYDNSNYLLQAATAMTPTQLNGFKIVPQIDGNGATALSTNYTAVAAYLKKFYDAPSRWLLSDGRFVVSTFKHEAQTPAHWKSVSDAMLATYGITIAWAGVFLSMSSASTYPLYASGYWGKGSNPGNVASHSQADSIAAKGRGEKFIGPVWPQDVRVRSSLGDETLGFRGMVAQWQKMIAWNADYILGTTWSDFSEGSCWNVTAHSGWCNLDVSSYFIHRIKTGAYPTITRDAVYLAHRNQFWDATLSQMTAGVQTSRMAWWNRGTGSTPKTDIIETLTFLTAPADVTVTAGGISTTYVAPAGMFSNTTPLRAGNVSVSMSRNGVPIGSITSPVVVKTNPKNDDIEYYKFSSLRSTAGQFSPMNQAPTYGNNQPLLS